MSISAEEKVCYLREAAIVLAKEGFQLDEVHTDRLCISDYFHYPKVCADRQAQNIM